MEKEKADMKEKSKPEDKDTNPQEAYKDKEKRQIHMNICINRNRQTKTNKTNSYTQQRNCTLKTKRFILITIDIHTALKDIKINKHDRHI